MPTPSDYLARSGANVSTTSSCSVKRTCGGIVEMYAAFYNESMTLRSLNKVAPFHRTIQRMGAITSQPVLGAFITNIAESNFR
jgi:hypothetical protein